MPRRVWAEPLYQAANRFREQCLIREGSLFLPDESIWTADAIDDFFERFIEDTSPDSFDEKLKRQLSGAPRETAVLAAELYFINLLAEHDSGSDIKQKHVKIALSFANDSIAVPEDLIDAFSVGIATLAQARNQRDRQFRFILELARQLKARDVEERKAILSDASRFRDFQLEIPRHGAGYQLEAFLHLFFPDEYEPIVSTDAKRQIARTFAEYIG